MVTLYKVTDNLKLYSDVTQCNMYSHIIQQNVSFIITRVSCPTYEFSCYDQNECTYQWCINITHSLHMPRNVIHFLFTPWDRQAQHAFISAHHHKTNIQTSQGNWNAACNSVWYIALSYEHGAPLSLSLSSPARHVWGLDLISRTSDPSSTALRV